MRASLLVGLLLTALAGLALAPQAGASPCTTTDTCVGACVLRSAACDNDGDSGYNACVFGAVAFACVPYRDCPPGFGCHPQYGVGADLTCDLTTSSCTK